MKRRKFIKSCCIAGVGIPIMGAVMSSCESLYYAQHSSDSDRITIALSEFYKMKNDKKTARKFVLIYDKKSKFPICVYRIGEQQFVASLLKCTHQGCELNVGGGSYSCPCHGAEFSTEGKVLEGPAQSNLKTFKTTIENENIIVQLS